MKQIARFIGVAMVLGLVAGAVAPAQAATVAELQAMIAQLQAQLSGLAGTPAPTATFTTDLTIGSRGADVTALQNWLIAKGHLAAGNNTGYFGPLTAAALAKYQVSKGITPAAGYFGPITRTAVNAEAGAVVTNPSTPSTGTGSTLTGGAGDLDVKHITSGTEGTVAEGTEENVYALELEADDNSDIGVTSIRVTADITSTGGAPSAATRLNRYVDEVIVYLGDKEVGSVSASDFTRSGADHTGTISLKNAIVKKGQKARLYVAFVASDVIEKNDQTKGTVTVGVDRIRFEDATGAIISDPGVNNTAAVKFEDSTENDGARIQTSSATPASTILKVKENQTSDEYHVFTYRIKADTDSSDTVITNVKLIADIADAGSSRKVSDIISNIYLKVGSQKYDDFDLDETTFNNSTSTLISFEIDEGDLEIAGGDTEDVEVYVKFGRQTGKYATSTTVKLTATGAYTEAENPNGDVIELNGTAASKVHTLDLAAATIGNYSWSVPNTGNFIDFLFRVEADDEDFTVLASSLNFATSGTATVSAPVLSVNSGDADQVSAGVEYKVLSGDTATFRVRYTITGDNGTWAEVKINSVAGQSVPNDKQTSPTATRNIQS